MTKHFVLDCHSRCSHLGEGLILVEQLFDSSGKIGGQNGSSFMCMMQAIQYQTHAAAQYGQPTSSLSRVRTTL